MATKNIVPNGNGEGGIGVTGKRWNTGFINTITGNLTGNVTGNTSGTAATVTGAAQGSITSLGTLTTLTVDNVIVNGTTIGHTSDTDLLTLADQSLTVAGALTVSGAGNSAFSGPLFISHSSGDSLTLTKDTTEPSLRLEGDSNKDFVITVSGELLTFTQNNGTTDILTLDHDTKNATFAGDMSVSGGNIGIGATSSSYKLRIVSDATVTNGIYLSAGSSSSNHILYVENQDSSAEYFAVRGDGEIRLNASSGHTYAVRGIRFGANSTNNNLDDYEEGTWSPLPYYQNADDQGKALAAQVTASQTAGFYTKIGNMVHVHGIILWNISDAVGDIAVDNVGVKTLPFASANETNNFSAINFALTGANTIPSGGFTGELSPNSTILLISSPSVAGNQGRNLGTGDITVKFSCSYRATT